MIFVYQKGDSHFQSSELFGDSCWLIIFYVSHLVVVTLLLSSKSTGVFVELLWEQLLRNSSISFTIDFVVSMDLFPPIPCKYWMYWL